MPTFTLGECSIDLVIEPLTGDLTSMDRQAAWRVYLELVTRPALREDRLEPRELHDLIRGMHAVLEQWPAAQIESPRPSHLGFLLVSVIELILLPCLIQGGSAPDAWQSVREFCAATARELADHYRFPDAGATVPRDLLAAWQSRS